MAASRRRGAISLSLSIVFILVLACGTGLHLLDLRRTSPAHLRLSLHNTVTSSSSVPYQAQNTTTTNSEDIVATLKSETIVNLVTQDDIMFEDYSSNNDNEEDDDSDVASSSSRQQQDVSGAEGPLLFFNISQPSIEEAILDKFSELSSFDGANTNCVLQPVEKKVALMFLSTAPHDGIMPHEQLWDTWLESVAGLIPISALSVGNALCLQQCRGGECVKRCGRQTTCNPLCKDALWRAYGAKRNGRKQQHLFSLYTHPPAGYTYGKDSIFHGTEVASRVDLKNSHSEHDQTEAAKLLIQEALKDPRNEWFVLLSPDTIPLYSPATMWQQLANENQSKINACSNEYKNTNMFSKNSINSNRPTKNGNNKATAINRWLPPLEMATSKFQPSDHWRSSSQWFVLNRKHADLVAQDVELAAAFKTYCGSSNIGGDGDSSGEEEEAKEASAKSKVGGNNGQEECVSYEHYVPSLLAMHGLEKETTCWWQGGTFTDWQTNIPPKSDGTTTEMSSPRIILPGELTADMINEMRNNNGSTECGGEVALSASQVARESFIDVNLLDEQVCTGENGKVNRAKIPGKRGAYAKAALPSQCNLLAWKADKRVSGTLLSVFKDCDSELGVLECEPELTSANKQWW